MNDDIPENFEERDGKIYPVTDEPVDLNIVVNSLVKENSDIDENKQVLVKEIKDKANNIVICDNRKSEIKDKLIDIKTKFGAHLNPETIVVIERLISNV